MTEMNLMPNDLSPNSAELQPKISLLANKEKFQQSFEKVKLWFNAFNSRQISHKGILESFVINLTKCQKILEFWIVNLIQFFKICKERETMYLAQSQQLKFKAIQD